MADIEYIIKGDTEEFKDCLAFTCGKSKERAEEILNRILNNPTENDLMIIKGLTNLRITEVPQEKCWWNRNCD